MAKLFLILAASVAVVGILFRLVVCVRSSTPQITEKEDKILQTSRFLSWGLAIGLAITAPICLIPWMWLKVAMLVILWTIAIFLISIDLSLVWGEECAGRGSYSEFYTFLDSIPPYTWDRTSSDELGGGDC